MDLPDCDVVRAVVARVLGFGRASEVDPERSLTELGLDSISAAELAESLGRAIGRAAPLADIFDHPTVHRLFGHLDVRTER